MNKSYLRGILHTIAVLVVLVAFMNLMNEKQALNEQGCYLQADNDVVCVEEEQ